MSLVIELEEKQKRENRQLLETMAIYLRSLKIKDVSLVDSDSEVTGYGGSYREPVIQLKGQYIDSIRLQSADWLTCGSANSVYRFIYQIIPNRDLADGTGLKINAKTKIVRSKTILGVAVGDITDVKWTGDELARQLNADTAISAILTKCTKSWKNIEFQVQTVSASMVHILSPGFADINYLKGLYSTEHSEKLEDCILGFNICHKIAQHVREIMGR